MIPNGVLIFFPSYPIMTKCQEQWQMEGLWGSINDIKVTMFFINSKMLKNFGDLVIGNLCGAEREASV